MKKWDREKRIYSKLFFYLTIYLIIFDNLLSQELFSNYKKYDQSSTKYKLTKITQGLDFAWGMTFIDDINLVATEKDGRILKINTKNGEINSIKHKIPSLTFNGSGQGGLLDVLYHEGFLYFSYSHDHRIIENQKGSATAIARGKLFNNEIKDLEILLVAKPKSYINKHWGSRLIIHKNFLYASFGERDLGMIAQDPTKHPGSIIRIGLDGSVPKNNPKFNGYPTWLPEIFQIGVRNPQGMAISPHDGNIYISQHGPRGGDNVGKIQYAGNYGWKDVAWGGKEYYGAKIGNVPFKKKYNEHLITWVPSIGVGQISFYTGKAFKEWDGDLIVSAAGAGLLLRLEIEDNKIEKREVILKNTLGRIRDFEINYKGEIYIVVDEENGSLWKLSK